MKTITQAYIAKTMGVSPAYINYLVNTKKRPSWKTAKKIASVTNTDPILWLEGSSNEIRAALKQGSQAQ
jgi:transcriptional regulator with XRE-family HTH domain